MVGGVRGCGWVLVGRLLVWVGEERGVSRIVYGGVARCGCVSVGVGGCGWLWVNVGGGGFGGKGVVVNGYEESSVGVGGGG